MEAQRFADDFDGIVAGAPANYWTHLLTSGLWDERALLDDPRDHSAGQTSGIQKAAVDQCDALDGVKDGLSKIPASAISIPASSRAKALIRRSA